MEMCFSWLTFFFFDNKGTSSHLIIFSLMDANPTIIQIKNFFTLCKKKLLTVISYWMSHIQKSFKIVNGSMTNKRGAKFLEIFRNI